jgi:hypothetical protein
MPTPGYHRAATTNAVRRPSRLRTRLNRLTTVDLLEGRPDCVGVHAEQVRPVFQIRYLLRRKRRELQLGQIVITYNGRVGHGTCFLRGIYSHGRMLFNEAGVHNVVPSNGKPAGIPVQLTNLNTRTFRIAALRRPCGKC